ncbi:MAG: hypothetical protein SFV54_04130 [Bryobacteraceae bacterium]|nr:hypothetical protein [Bryobacteraceae bacterium]
MVWPLLTCCEAAPQAAGEASGGAQNLVRNGGFEQGGGGLPEGWFRDMNQTGKKGSVEMDRRKFHSGQASVRLSPNRNNSAEHSLAIAQIIPAAAYRGKKVRFSGRLAAEGGATAVLGVLSVVGGRPQNLAAVTQPSGGGGFTEMGETYDVPDDSSVQLVVACSASGQSGSVWFDDVAVVFPATARNEASTSGGAGRAPERATSSPAVPPSGSGGAMAATINIDAGRVIRQIPKTLYGMDLEWIWNSYMMWDEQQRRPNPELMRLAKELGVTVYRYPGGYYGDFYHWKNGVGPVEKRPEMRHDAGSNDKSRANFGTDEALQFARDTGAELLITVNAGSGTAQEAAEWVKYVNGGNRRVRFWEVGNELYIKDNSPLSRAIAIDGRTYAQRFRDYALAMRAADPGIKVIGIGGVNQGRYSFISDANWTRHLLEKGADQLDYIAVHNAYAPVNVNSGDDLRKVYRAMLANPINVAKNLEAVGAQIDKYGGAHASKIGIAVTEWGPLFQMDQRGAYVLHNRTLGSALYSASLLKVFIENPRTHIANGHTLHDLNIMGFIGSRNDSFPPRPDWYPTARYYAFQMFTRHFGDALVATQTTAPTYDSEAVGLVDAVRDAPWLDVVTSKSADGRKLFVMAVNKNFDQAIEGSINVSGANPGAEATAWTLSGTGLDAHTGTVPLKLPGMSWGRQAGDGPKARIDKGSPNEIAVSSKRIPVGGRKFSYTFPPHSVTSLELNLR